MGKRSAGYREGSSGVGRELVSRQKKKTQGVGGWTKHQNMKVKTEREDQGIRGGLRLNRKDVGRKEERGK